ncbi:Histone-binding protein MSI1, partial [Striga hermonthica]
MPKKPDSVKPSAKRREKLKQVAQDFFHLFDINEIHEGVFEDVAWHLRHAYLFCSVGDDEYRHTWDLRTPAVSKPIQSVDEPLDFKGLDCLLCLKSTLKSRSSITLGWLNLRQWKLEACLKTWWYCCGWTDRRQQLAIGDGFLDYARHTTDYKSGSDRGFPLRLRFSVGTREEEPAGPPVEELAGFKLFFRYCSSFGKGQRTRASRRTTTQICVDSNFILSFPQNFLPKFSRSLRCNFPLLFGDHCSSPLRRLMLLSSPATHAPALLLSSPDALCCSSPDSCTVVAPLRTGHTCTAPTHLPCSAGFFTLSSLPKGLGGLVQGGQYIGKNRRALSAINANITGVPPHPRAVVKRGALKERFAAQVAVKEQHPSLEKVKPLVQSNSSTNCPEDCITIDSIDEEDHRAMDEHDVPMSVQHTEAWRKSTV